MQTYFIIIMICLQGGGVCVFIRNNLAFNPRPDLHSHHLEAMWFELYFQKLNRLSLGHVIAHQTIPIFLNILRRPYLLFDLIVN